jgi:hypothetical protein
MNHHSGGGSGADRPQRLRSFRKKDFAGAVTFMDPDVRVSDLLRPGRVMHGRDTVLLQWIRRFDEARVGAFVADVVEGAGETALAAVCFQAFTADDTAVGRPFIVASRFTFDEGDSITGLHHTPFNDVADDVRALFHEYEPPNTC